MAVGRGLVTLKGENLKKNLFVINGTAINSYKLSKHIYRPIVSISLLIRDLFLGMHSFEGFKNLGTRLVRQ